MNEVRDIGSTLINGVELTIKAVNSGFNALQDDGILSEINWDYSSDKLSPIDARFSWRLMDQTSESITNEILNIWANKIYKAFFNPVFSFAKGKYIGWYISPQDGLHLQLYCLDETTAESVAKKIVSS